MTKAQNGLTAGELQKLVVVSRALAQQVLALTESLKSDSTNDMPIASVDNALVVGNLVIDPSSWSVKINDQSIHLSRMEFLLLLSLAERGGQVVSCDELLMEVWHCESEWGSRNLVANCVHRVRSKISRENAREFDLQAIPGVGYRLCIGTAHRSKADQPEVLEKM